MAEPGITRPASELRHSLRAVMLAWSVGAVWLYLTTGAVFTRFAKLLDMPRFGFGVLAALPFAGALAQLPVSYFITRYGHRKPVFIGLGVAHRLLWVPIALIPWLLPAGWQWRGLLLLFGLSWLAGQMVTPVWVSWMADLVPGRIRGRYFSRRSQLGQLIGIAVTVLMGYALDHAELRGAQTLLQVVCLAIGLGAVYGAIDFLFFVKVPDVQRVKPDPDVNIWHMLREPLRDRNFRRFLGFTATLTLSVGFVAQFVWLFLFDVAGMSNTQANAMLVLMPLVILLISGPMWGRLVDRFGCKPILIIAGIMIIPGCVGWLFVARDNWVWGYLCVVVATVAWPAIEISNFNILLNLSDPDAGRPRPGAYVAVNSAVTAIAGILSGLLGGIVAEAMGDWRTTFCGWPVTYHIVLFLISTVLRILALFWLWGFVDARAATPRAALRYMGTNLYSNLQQRVFIPGRLLQQFGRWTFPVNKRRRR